MMTYNDGRQTWTQTMIDDWGQKDWRLTWTQRMMMIGDKKVTDRETDLDTYH